MSKDKIGSVFQGQIDEIAKDITNCKTQFENAQKRLEDMKSKFDIANQKAIEMAENTEKTFVELRKQKKSEMELTLRSREKDLEIKIQKIYTQAYGKVKNTIVDYSNEVVMQYFRNSLNQKKTYDVKKMIDDLRIN